jgi:LuxR family maltose regulon positive regulatory protein
VAAQTRLELTRVNLRLGDFTGARTLMREVTELLRRRPDLGIVGRDARALWPLTSRRSGSSRAAARRRLDRLADQWW